jgi:hypothetical protein
VTRGEDGPVRYEIAITTEVVVDAKGKFNKAGDEEDEHDERSLTRDKKSKKGDDKDDDDDDDD